MTITEVAQIQEYNGYHARRKVISCNHKTNRNPMAVMEYWIIEH